MHLRNNRPDHRINFWAKIPATTPASTTPGKPRKRARKKNEYTRPGALLPDVIRLNNHVEHTRTSRKEFKSRCQSLNQVCTKEEICDAHSSLNNLRKISQSFNRIINRPLETAPDWKKFKRVHSRNFGYLNAAVNHPEIKQEIEQIRVGW